MNLTTTQYRIWCQRLDGTYGDFLRWADKSPPDVFATQEEAQKTMLTLQHSEFTHQILPLDNRAFHIWAKRDDGSWWWKMAVPKPSTH